MPNLDIVREEVLQAALDVVGEAGRSMAERIADQVAESFRAHGWEVFTEEEIDGLDDTPRLPEE